VAAIGVWLLAPLILRIWLGADPGTTIILPLVLIHTVIGGSSTTGRAILLAMGKFKPFTASVLIAGAVNVVASLLLREISALGFARNYSGDDCRGGGAVRALDAVVCDALVITRAAAGNARPT